MTVSPRVTHNLVTPQLAALTCMCDFHLNQAQYRFCVCLQSIDDSSDRSQSSMFYYHYYDRHFVCIQIGIRQQEAEFWTSSQTML